MRKNKINLILTYRLVVYATFFVAQSGFASGQLDASANELFEPLSERISLAICRDDGSYINCADIGPSECFAEIQHIKGACKEELGNSIPDPETDLEAFGQFGVILGECMLDKLVSRKAEFEQKEINACLNGNKIKGSENLK